MLLPATIFLRERIRSKTEAGQAQYIYRVWNREEKGYKQVSKEKDKKSRVLSLSP